MLKFYYDTKYKYTNRTIIDLTGDSNYKEVSYLNIDTPDTINGHIVYTFGKNETDLPTYIYDTETSQRWFVSGITPVSARKKYQISLLRDIISENPALWANETNAYVAAGLAGANNYNKYKRWGLPFTNTKVNQQKLTINGGSSFYVFYVNEQHVTNGTVTSEDDLELEYTTIPGITSFDYEVNGLASIPSGQFIGAGDVTYTSSYICDLSTIMYQTDKQPAPYLTQNTKVVWRFGNGPAYVLSESTSDAVSPYFYVGTPYLRVENNENSALSDMQTAINNAVTSWLNTNYPTRFTATDYANLAPYQNKTILDTSTSHAYILRLSIGTAQVVNDYLSNTTLTTALSSINWPQLDTSNTRNFERDGNIANLKQTIYTLNWYLEDLGTATSIDLTLKANVRKLPKSAVRCLNIAPTGTISKEEMSAALMIAQTNGINPDNTTGRILDIQYLPFTVATAVNNNILINNTPMTAQFLELDDFQYDINLTDLTNINKETDTIKIVSPSRASQYLFKPYDNDGNMEFAAKITIKPYTSTIYVRPSTKGLLMQDWDDKDCLIIQEDMSLTNVTSEWTNYVYNNRNYLNSFERQIQGREFERGWERRVEEANMAADDWTARNISAQKAQTYTLNIPLVSDIAAAIGTAWADDAYMKAAQVDREYNEAMYREGVSLSRDLFEYQLENIKSQPLIPSRITTIDCKFLDGIYLEFYSTNPTELAAIAKYYEYNGNRIDDYGSFADYWGNFVRGKLIKAVNYTQPEVNELNRRLEMGIFTGGITV